MRTHLVTVYTDHPFCLSANPLFWLRVSRDVNAVLSRSGITRQIHIAGVSSDYREPDNNPHGMPLRTDDFPILLCIAARANTGGWCAPDSCGGFGMCIRLRPNANLELSDDYDRFIYTILHEFGHGFELGISELYSTNVIPSSGEPWDLGVNSLDYWTCDYWCNRPDLYNDPMRSNIAPFRFSHWHTGLINSAAWRVSTNARFNNLDLHIHGITSDCIIRVETGLKVPSAYQYKDYPAYDYIGKPLILDLKRNSAENMARVTVLGSVYPITKYFSIFDAESRGAATMECMPKVTKPEAPELSVTYIDGYLYYIVKATMPNTILFADKTPINVWETPGYHSGVINPDYMHSGVVFTARSLPNINLSDYFPK